MKLVQFTDGTFGIRVGSWLNYRFIDLDDPIFTWGRKSKHLKSCKGTKEKAKEIITKLSTTHKVIK